MKIFLNMALFLPLLSAGHSPSGQPSAGHTPAEQPAAGQPSDALLKLAGDGKSSYVLLLPAEASEPEQHSAEVFLRYFEAVTGVRLPVEREPDRSSGGNTGAEERSAQKVTAAGAGSSGSNGPQARRNGPVISIGNTALSERILPAARLPESYFIQSDGDNLLIGGGSGKGLLYGVYTFVERFLGCRKWSAGEPPLIPRKNTLILPGTIDVQESPAFGYREVYLPASGDPEYLNWHKLHRFVDLWGLWGHSFDKLVPAATYFGAHPEYFALIDGQRRPAQLCLSRPEVLDIAVEALEKRMEEHPEAVYWSVSPNDEPVYCECGLCSAADAEEGGPQGSLVRFVNKIAARFPEKTFTTLAYASTSRPPLKTSPASNVIIFLSSIDAYRSKPLPSEPSAKGFREDLKGWKARNPGVFVWDYFTQFTNYLAPFPNVFSLDDNIRYFRDQDVKGVFAQGSGQTYSDMAELKGYLLAKLLWDPGLDASRVIDEFLAGYYKKAAPFVKQYLLDLERIAGEKKKNLDIYGNPVNDQDTYLSPADIDHYSQLMDKAEAAAESDPEVAERIRRIRLTHEYTVLQQARFYGIEQHGIFERSSTGGWDIRKGFPERVVRFSSDCALAGVNELSEGGIGPEAYRREWEQIFAGGVRPNLALGGKITALTYPYVEDYPAKGERTLTDGSPGYGDFSYNWLCFYGVPMELTIDLGQVRRVETVSLNFLEDPRHWIFRPAGIKIALSRDGSAYTDMDGIICQAPEESYEVRKFPVTLSLPSPVSCRYLRIRAEPLPGVPSWRYSKRKKPMLACDEVWVD